MTDRDSASRLQDALAQGMAASEVGERWHFASVAASHGRAALRVAVELLGSEDPEAQRFGAQVLGRLDPRETALCDLATSLLYARLPDAGPGLASELAAVEDRG